MQEKWNQFVYDLYEAKKRDVDEDIYHSLIETQMQLLGWAKWKGEICHKPNIPIGNSKFIQPDILIKCGDEDQFVIEVKRPVHTQTERERVQLESYMRQLKLDVGVYIGEHIEVFYDKPKSKDAVSVLRIPLEIDNKLGAKFVEKFSKETFTKDSIVEFCEARMEEMNRQANLNKIKEGLIANAQVQITESLTPYLMEKYGSTFSEADIKGMLSELHFSASLTDAPALTAHKDTTSETIQTLPTDDTKKRAYDHTGYSLEGGEFLGKNKFVYAVVSTYVKQHPNATFAEIKRVFPPELQGSFGVVQTIEYIKEKNFKGRRYFKEPENVLRSCDGISFAVSTEWGKDNIRNFLKVVRQLGYRVETSPSVVSNNETAERDEGRGLKATCSISPFVVVMPMPSSTRLTTRCVFLKVACCHRAPFRRIVTARSVMPLSPPCRNQRRTASGNCSTTTRLIVPAQLPVTVLAAVATAGMSG